MRCSTMIFLFTLISGFCFEANAQRRCGTDEHHQQRLQTDPEYAKRHYELINMPKQKSAPFVCATPVTIPVAVHFNQPIDCSSKECLMTTVNNQLIELNAAFSAKLTAPGEYEKYLDLNAACPSSYPLSSAPVQDEGACVKFCLATKNHPPQSGLADGEPAITVGKFDWPGPHPIWAGYLNIFVSTTNPPLGESPLPGLGNGDGTHIYTTAFGGLEQTCTSGGPLNSDEGYNLGGTTIHEIGHYLGLPHIFADDNENCTVDTDQMPPGPLTINDTPPQDESTSGLPIVNNCADVPEICYGQPSAFYSFMDYTDDAGMSIFTADQSAVMNWHANNISFKSNTTVCDAALTDYANLIINCDPLLPVELSNFTGEATKRGNLLEWTTQTETNNKGFYVEHSLDALTFEIVTFIEAKGDTQEPTDYTYMDADIRKNTDYYYRLQQVDFDGKTTYSNVIHINNKIISNTVVRVYPNLITDDFVTIKCTDNHDLQNINYKIFDAAGKLLIQRNITANETQINLNSLNAGVYFIRIEGTNISTCTEKLIKSK